MVILQFIYYNVIHLQVCLLITEKDANIIAYSMPINPSGMGRIVPGNAASRSAAVQCR